jgi:hypothetical protein
VESKLWGVYEFSWGTAVKNEVTGEWTNVFNPDGSEIVVEGLGVQVTEEGVIFNEQSN